MLDTSIKAAASDSRWGLSNDREHIHTAYGHALSTYIAHERSLVVGMGEDDLLRALVHAGHAGDAFFGVNVIDAVLLLLDSPYRADLGTHPALGAGAHFEDAGIREVGLNGQTSLLGVVLSEVK